METTTKNNTQLEVLDLGLIEYDQALEIQLQTVEEVHASQSPGKIILCTHPPVVTLGRATQEGDVFSWSGKTVEVTRGGRATYHGPSQVVAYPIVNLAIPRKSRKDREVVGFLRILEDAIVNSLKEYGIQAEGRTLQKDLENKTADNTGVWIENRKIASLGIGVRKWIAFHGAAINVLNDPQAFMGMNPCGFSKDIMTSVEKELGKQIDPEEYKKILLKNLQEAL